MGQIGQLWDQVEVDKIFLAEQSETSDSESASGNTDSGSDWVKESSASVRFQSDAEEEQDLDRKRSTRRLKRDYALLNLPVPEQLRAKYRRNRSQEDIDDCFDELEDDEGSVFEPQQDLSELLQRVLQTEPEAEPEKIRRLRALSQGRHNLHRLLSVSKDSSQIDSVLLIHLIKTTLHREGLRAKTLKKHNEFLLKRYQTERAARLHVQKRIQQEKSLFKSKTSANTDLSEIQNFLQSILKEERLQTLRQSQRFTDIKWCEVPFFSITPQSSPYRYSFFGIWYEAEWEYSDVHLCVAIGGVQPSMVSRFRQLSGAIQ